MSSQEKSAKKGSPEGSDAFWLTDLYPDAAALFSHRQASLEEISQDCIVVLDANMLLWPFELENASVEDIAKVYKELAEQGRLIVPGQAAREYYKHRSQKVAALTEILDGAVSRAQRPPLDKPIPLLSNDDDYVKARELNTQIINLGKEMVTRLKAASEKLKGEIGNDRVSRIYAEVLPDCVVDLNDMPARREAIIDDAARRAKLLIAPGYKDHGKEDGGIGDLMIWLTALQEGERRKKHCIFVTNEQKADWWVKSRGTFQPRPELLEEYRRHSAGKSVHFLPLSGLLASFQATAGTVKEVRKLEDVRREDAASFFNATWHGSRKTPDESEVDDLARERRIIQREMLITAEQIREHEHRIAQEDPTIVDPIVWSKLEELKRTKGFLSKLMKTNDKKMKIANQEELFREIAIDDLEQAARSVRLHD